LTSPNATTTTRRDKLAVLTCRKTREFQTCCAQRVASLYWAADAGVDADDDDDDDEVVVVEER